MPLTTALKKTIIVITLFSIAMGFLESAVVVYLRELYYPRGFSFPMVTLEGHIALTEILREVATMVMLLTIAWLTGKTFLERFSWFIFCFGVWDIFYYVFLKLLLDWPSSLFTWDILFLIPMVWTGPVIAPVIVSLTMIALALLILSNRIHHDVINTKWLVVLGAFVIFVSFIWDFSSYMLDRHSLGDMFKPDVAQIALEQYIPYRFKWIFFIVGELLILTGIFLSIHNTKRQTNAV